jgi:hypothetical protein
MRHNRASQPKRKRAAANAPLPHEWGDSPGVPRDVAKAARDERSIAVARDVVQVLHRGLHVGVAHPLLHAADVRLGDHARAERVPQVVEAQGPQAGAL